MNEKHRPLERKVYVTVIDEDDGSVDYVEEYREVCEVCVPKYSAYKPWPCEYARPAHRTATHDDEGTGR